MKSVSGRALIPVVFWVLWDHQRGTVLRVHSGVHQPSGGFLRIVSHTTADGVFNPKRRQVVALQLIHIPAVDRVNRVEIKTAPTLSGCLRCMVREEAMESAHSVRSGLFCRKKKTATEICRRCMLFDLNRRISMLKVRHSGSGGLCRCRPLLLSGPRE